MAAELMRQQQTQVMAKLCRGVVVVGIIPL